MDTDEHATSFSNPQAAHRVKHLEGEEEDDMPSTNLSKLVCLKSQGEKVRRCAIIVKNQSLSGSVSHTSSRPMLMLI